MRAHLSSLKIQMLVCLVGLLICVVSHLPAYGADGDIIISRQVQPRAAVRQELKPDPRPQVANPRRDVLLNKALSSGLAPMELSDTDFAGINSGSRFTEVFSVLPAGGVMNPALSAAGAKGFNSAGHGGGAAGRAGGQVGRSVQQGLRPLQILRSR